jgi:hypothetical protein
MVGAKATRMKRNVSTTSHRSRPTFSRRTSATNTRPGSPAVSDDSDELDSSSSGTSVSPSIHDLLAASLAVTPSKRPRRRAYDAYDRFGAVVSVPLSSSRTAEEVLDEDDILAGGDEWEDEDPTATVDSKDAVDLVFDLPAFLDEARRAVGPVTGMAPFARGVYHQVRPLASRLAPLPIFAC